MRELAAASQATAAARRSLRLSGSYLDSTAAGPPHKWRHRGRPQTRRLPQPQSSAAVPTLTCFGSVVGHSGGGGSGGRSLVRSRTFAMLGIGTTSTPWIMRLVNAAAIGMSICWAVVGVGL